MNDDRQIELPYGWELKKIGDVCSPPQYGWTTSSSNEGRIKLLRTTDITSGIIEWQRVPFCKEEPPQIEKYILHEGDIVISRAGSVGFSMLINNPELSVFASYLIRFRSTPIVNSKYFSFFLKSPAYWQAISEKSLGIAIPNVNASKIKDIIIPIAPLSEQQRIVAKIEELFSQLDAAEAALKRAKANLKRYRQSVLQAAVTGELTRAWREAHASEIEPAGALLERIRAERRAKWEAEQRAKGKDPAKEKYVEPQGPDKSKLPELPEGWVWVSLSSITTQIGDVDHKMPKAVNSEIPYISTRDFRDNGEIDFETAKKISIADYSSLSRKIYPTKGDILLSRYGTVGEVRVVKTERPFQASYSIAIVKPLHNSVSVDYLAYLLQAKVSQDQIKRYTRATAQPDLGLAHIKLIMIPLATLMEQRQIMLEIERQISVTQKLEVLITESQSRIISLKQKILEFAFKGEL